MAILVTYMSNVVYAAVVETIDARIFEGEIMRLDDKGVTIKAQNRERIVDDVSKIIIKTGADLPDLLKTKHQAVVLSQAGDVLQARANLLRLEKNQFCVDPGETGRRMELPLKAVKAILLPGEEQTCEEIQKRCEEMQCKPGVKDLLLIVGKDGKLQKVTGTLLGMADGQVRFSYRGKDRIVKVGRVRAILLAKPTEVSRRPGGWVRTTEGSVYAFWKITFADGLYTLQRRWGPAINVSWNDVADVTFHSDRLVYLARMKPSKVTQHGMFDTAISYRAGRSAGGGPILLAGRRYETGLGLHSVCELKYDLGGKYQTFLATAGIDDAVRPNGEATLTIMGDELIIFYATLAGGVAPKQIRLEVKGVKTLTLRVDLGPDKLDAADHVDLAGARLVK